MPRKISLDDPTRLYNSDFLERITRAHPSEPFFVFIPIVLSLMAYTLISGPNSWYLVVGVFLAGAFFWTFCEYILHRWLFHYEAKTAFGKKQMRLIHGIHHQFPNDTDRLVIPPVAGLTVAGTSYCLYALILGPWLAMPFLAGWVTGYMGYDFTHYSTHHRKPLTRIGRTARRRHLLHHYRYPDACYGVSTGLWDWVFRTTEKYAKTDGKDHGGPQGIWEILDNKIV